MTINNVTDVRFHNEDVLILDDSMITDGWWHIIEPKRLYFLLILLLKTQLCSNLERGGG